MACISREFPGSSSGCMLYGIQGSFSGFFMSGRMSDDYIKD